MEELWHHVGPLTPHGVFRADGGMLIRPDFSNLRINERALTCCSAALASPLTWKLLHSGLASRGEAEAAAIQRPAEAAAMCRAVCEPAEEQDTIHVGAPGNI